MDERDSRRSWIAAIAALAFHAANGLTALVMGVFPVSLDELQHLSFVRTMEASPTLAPAYERMRVLDGRAQAFTPTANYLNHPSPYYIAMGWVDRAVGGSIHGLRLANLGLSLVAMALLLAAGFRVLKDWKTRSVFAAALVLFPKAGVVAGLINNDNAALLATAVAVLGLVEWQRRPGARSALLLALGLAFCGWTKLTVFLMTGFGVAIAEALRLRAAKGRPPLAASGLVAAGLAVAAIPTLVNLAVYGRLLHHPSMYYVPPERRVALSFGRYAVVFLRNMAEKWAALEPSRPVQVLGLALALALAFTAVFAGQRRLRGAPEGDESAAWRVASGLILATLPVLLTHLYFGWRTFQEDGFVEMAQTRYYYGVWPGFALGLALLWRWWPPRPGRAVVTVAVGATLLSSTLVALGLAMLLHGQAWMMT